MVHVESVGDGWIPLAEAAEQLGVSKHAARRRIQRGELKARQVRTRYGLAWQVRLDGDDHPHATVASPSREPRARVAPDSRDSRATLAEPSDLGELVALVSSLSERLAESAAVAAMWQERARVLTDQLALAAPHQPTDASTEAPASEPSTEPAWLLGRSHGFYSAAAIIGLVAAIGLAMLTR